MSVEKMDTSWGRLYPAFQHKLKDVLDEMEQRTGKKWLMLEGYRSQERQTWLYASGRTRPGDIVTKLKTPKHHGVGLAADCYPQKTLYKTPKAEFDLYRKVYQARGLENPAWSFGDFGHVQWPADDIATHTKAGVWARAGFPIAQEKLPKPEVPVYVRGVLVQDADGVLTENTLWVALRPVAEAYGWSILEAKAGKAILSDGLLEKTVEYTLRDKRAFLPLFRLGDAFQASMHWEAKKKVAHIG